MSPLTISLISFIVIFSGLLFGFYLSTRLPEHHLSPDSKEAVKMTWGVVATLTALVLGLLIASAKTTYDTVNNERTDAAAKLIVLSNTLRRYGHEADSIRHDLRDLVAAGIKRDWPEETVTSDIAAAPANSNLMEDFQDKLSQLTPATEAQRSLLARAHQLCDELSMGRWLVIEQSTSEIPAVLFAAVIFWLTVLFIGLGMFAPRNKMTLIGSVFGIISLSIGIFIVSDLSYPLGGLISVSSTSMHDVWQHLSQQ